MAWISGPGKQFFGDAVDQQRPRRIFAELGVVSGLPGVGRRSAIHQHLRGDRLAVDPQQRHRRVTARRQVVQQAPDEGGVMGVGQQRGALLALPARFLHRQERFRRPARRRRRSRSFTTSTAPSADNLFQSWRSFLRVDPDRLTPNSRVTNGRVVSESISGAMPRCANTFSIEEWLGDFGVERFQADDVRQLRAVFDRGEKRRDDLVRESRDRPRDWKGKRSCTAALPAPPAATAQPCAIAGPRRRRACAARRPAPRPAASGSWRSRCRRPPSTRPGS